MRKILTTLAVTAAVLMLALADADASWRCRHRTRHAVTYQAHPVAPTSQAVAMATPSQPAPQTVAATPSDGYGAALAEINAARALIGRRPLGWDAGLAAWASRNFGSPRAPHQVMAPGAGQCQAWCGDPVTAARQWLHSAAHYQILMSATAAIGISADQAGGYTANAR